MTNGRISTHGSTQSVEGGDPCVLCHTRGNKITPGSRFGADPYVAANRQAPTSEEQAPIITNAEAPDLVAKFKTMIYRTFERYPFVHANSLFDLVAFHPYLKDLHTTRAIDITAIVGELVAEHKLVLLHYTGTDPTNKTPQYVYITADIWQQLFAQGNQPGNIPEVVNPPASP